MKYAGRTNKKFEVVSDYTPSGDQPAAIQELARRINNDEKDIVLLGATGTGKSATTAWLIEQVQRPTLILGPNKTLAAQLVQEFRTLMPHNAIEYFVSYYDYYQPEAYIPQSDTFIEKDSSINKDIERLRYSTTKSLLTRRDCVVVSSVSCIYGLGSPDEYLAQMVFLAKGDTVDHTQLLRKFVSMQYNRNDVAFERGNFRVRGDIIEIIPVYEELAVRIELFGDEVDRISMLDPVTGDFVRDEDEMQIFPATHYVASPERIKAAVETIQDELRNCVENFRKQGKLVEAQRLEMRTQFDIEMLEQVGMCKGVENYSRHFDGRASGSPPNTLLDFFDDDYLLVIDESHITVPQIGAMFEGDAARKRNLIDHGFRLPSAKDNRPLKWNEFLERVGQTVYLSATPGSYELGKQEECGEEPVELIIRPTGLLDPEIQVRPIRGQIDDLYDEILEQIAAQNRIIVTTLTKNMAEDLSKFLLGRNVKTTYLHSDVDTLKRVEILRDLRLGVFDVLIGINLLREGLDLPEVGLVAILDADKQGFLRSARSLIQTIGRAARNVNGKVIMYADEVTPQMHEAITETNRRRAKQELYNKQRGITPQPLSKKITDLDEQLTHDDKIATKLPAQNAGADLCGPEKLLEIADELTVKMRQAAIELNFELAARLRDEISDLKREFKKQQE
ncbi:MAG: excinuclease ABC subunit UvrB [Candidatus Ancillula trichonymphae]|jgi:excinuclease ABC subunit B|nr:excinuclease ABC subunit UvrB [Candidatus Ancillula trichonymphae]